MLAIYIRNDATGPDEAANYVYVVKVNGKQIATGKILGHDCKNGWMNLLKMLLEQREEK